MSLSIEENYKGVKELIILGKEKGYLLYDEVNDALPDNLHSSEDLDAIFCLFGDAGIEVLDSEHQLDTVQKKSRPKKPATTKKQKRLPRPWTRRMIRSACICERWALSRC